MIVNFTVNYGGNQVTTVCEVFTVIKPEGRAQNTVPICLIGSVQGEIASCVIIILESSCVIPTAREMRPNVTICVSVAAA